MTLNPGPTFLGTGWPWSTWVENQHRNRHFGYGCGEEGKCRVAWKPQRCEGQVSDKEESEVDQAMIVYLNDS